MFILLETAIGFAAIMLLLSLLVKSMTSLVKNHIDYYATNFEAEFKEMVFRVRGKKWNDIKNKLGYGDLNFKLLGEEFLTKENLTQVLDIDKDAMKEKLRVRLQICKDNVRNTFAKRSKNLSLLLGMILCLGLNINAFTIWNSLYKDGNLRAKFSSEEYVTQALEKSEASAKAEQEAEQAWAAAQTEEKKKQLEKAREEASEDLAAIQGEVAFGMGKIWSAPDLGWWGMLFELMGSLLTGILVSIGAPYWHDLLRSLSNLRKPKPGA
jgi:hypothetical protein